jgi:beta-lactamase regulating signal transducer with metallopeptidase domain
MTTTIFPLVAWLLQATAKGSVAILLVAVAQQLIGRRVRARWRHALWLIVVLRLVVPVAPASAWSIFNVFPPHSGMQLQLRGEPGQMVFQAPPAEASMNAVPKIDVPWWIAGWRWIAAIWIAGVILIAVRALLATAKMRRIVKRAGSASPFAARQIVEQGRRQLGIARPVRVIETPLVSVPVLHGILQPLLLLPEGFSDAFTDDELRHVVLHELWHLRRHDIAFNWLLAAVQALHWFNPLVWFAVSRIDEERELACDELTLSCLEAGERFGYGRTILKLLERFRSVGAVPAVVGIVNEKEKMKRRLMMISTVRKRSPFAVPLLAALAAVCVIAFTDARGGERSPARLDPDGVGTLKRFDGHVSFDLTNGSFSDLLDKISNMTGVAVTQSPAIAGSRVQQARFTVHAENVPAQALLIETLLPFHLVSQPTAAGMTIGNAPACMVKHDAARGCNRTDGTMHKDLALAIDDEGMKSQGRLTIDVTGAMTK